MAPVFEWMDEWGPEKIIVVHDTKTGMQGMLVIDNTAAVINDRVRNAASLGRSPRGDWGWTRRRLRHRSGRSQQGHAHAVEQHLAVKRLEQMTIGASTAGARLIKGVLAGSQNVHRHAA